MSEIIEEEDPVFENKDLLNIRLEEKVTFTGITRNITNNIINGAIRTQGLSTPVIDNPPLNNKSVS